MQIHKRVAANVAVDIVFVLSISCSMFVCSVVLVIARVSCSYILSASRQTYQFVVCRWVPILWYIFNIKCRVGPKAILNKCNAYYECVYTLLANYRGQLILILFFSLSVYLFYGTALRLWSVQNCFEIVYHWQKFGPVEKPHHKKLNCTVQTHSHTHTYNGPTE